MKIQFESYKYEMNILIVMSSNFVKFNMTTNKMWNFQVL